MQYIKKNNKPIPKSLVDHRKSPLANYENFPHKDDLRDVLLEEQGHLCAYCMQPITKSKMKIEHWAPQKKHSDKELDYYNLLAVCKGGEGKKTYLQHCDTKKADREITLNPTLPQCETQVKLKYDGTVYSDDEKLNEEINKFLNLNQDFLVQNRYQVIEELNTAYKQKKGDIKFLKEKLNEYTEKPYKPFARFVRDWLGKKIKRQQFKEK